MPAPECTCNVEIDMHQLQAKVILCPLHKAASDLYEALEIVLGLCPWCPGRHHSHAVASAALAKANPQRTQEVQDAGE